MVSSQIVSIIHVSLSNYIPFFHYFLSHYTHYLSHIVYPLFHVPLSNNVLIQVYHSNCMLYRCFPLELYTLSMFLSKITCFLNVSLSDCMLYPCFPFKLYTSSMYPSQMVRFTHFCLFHDTH